MQKEKQKFRDVSVQNSNNISIDKRRRERKYLFTARTECTDNTKNTLIIINITGQSYTN